MFEREFRVAIAQYYLEAAEGHNLRDHEYVAIPLIVKCDTGHPENGANQNCFFNPIDGEELDMLKIKHSAVNAFRT